MNFVPDGEQVFGPHDSRDINYDEVYNKPFISISETCADKPHQYFLEILEKDSDDFYKFLCRRGSQYPYSYIVSELVIFTALRYHDAQFDDFGRSYWKGFSKLSIQIANVRYEYVTAFPKKGKSKKK
jgi:hypothetical protein